MEEKIAIGKILKPHGIKGEVVFLSFSGLFKKNLYTELYIKNINEYETLKLQKETKPYRKDKGYFLISFEGKDRESVEQLRNTFVFIDNLPYDSLKEGEFFYHDLENAMVYSNDKIIGKVLGVYNFSGPDVIEVEYIDEKDRSRSLFLPLQKPFLLELNIDAKSIYFGDIDGFI